LQLRDRLIDSNGGALTVTKYGTDELFIGFLPKPSNFLFQHAVKLRQRETPNVAQDTLDTTSESNGQSFFNFFHKTWFSHKYQQILGSDFA